MGRRKIEIQPITHERNRSVTFLKRKNGLFKKAYELGVLCSVDVAVIIFEERPGHEVKLHSYCSCDLRDVVQRQIRFQGERDSRGPGDFSGAAAARFDEDGDDNDDEDDDERRRVPKRKASSKLGMPSDMVNSNTPDYLPPLPHRNGLPHLGVGVGATGQYDEGPTSSIGSLMPVSNDRVSSLRSSTRSSKRARTSDSAPSRSLSPSLDRDRLYMLGDSHMNTGNGGGRVTTRNLRHAPQAHDQQGSTSVGLPHQQHPYHPGASAGGYGAPQQYGPLLPLGPPGALNIGHPPAATLPPPPPRFEPQYDPALYQHQYPPSMIRQTSVPGLGNRDAGNGGQPRDQRERGGGEMFAAFLEADERSRQMAATAAQRQHQDQMNWPGSPSTPNPSPSTAAPPGSQPAGPPADNWFDIFSGASASVAPPGSGSGGGTSNMTWPRIPPLGSIGDIARIINNSSGALKAEADAAEETKSAADPETVKDADETPGSANTKAVKENADEMEKDETEKDADGEDDVDVVEKDAQADNAMPVDSVDEKKDGGISMTDAVAHEPADDGDAKPGPKAGRGRPKRSTAGQRGRAKAKRELD